MRVYRTLILLTLTMNAADTDREPDRLIGNCFPKSAFELKRVIEEAKYIFVGRVYGARLVSDKVMYKVRIRRVLKGDLDEVGVEVRFGTAKALRFSGASVLVESEGARECPRYRLGTYAIFLTEKHRESGAKLVLVMEPLRLTLRSLEIIEAAVQDVVQDRFREQLYQIRILLMPLNPEQRTTGHMSVLPRGFEGCCRPCPRYGSVQGEYSIYYKRPRCGQPRPQPFQRECACYCGGPSNRPCEPPCCYDLPCKAHCFNHGAATRPSGRYARTTWFPGEWPPKVPPCQAFTCPNPPFHPCCYHTCNKHV